MVLGGSGPCKQALLLNSADFPVPYGTVSGRGPLPAPGPFESLSSHEIPMKKLLFGFALAGALVACQNTRHHSASPAGGPEAGCATACATACDTDASCDEAAMADCDGAAKADCDGSMKAECGDAAKAAVLRRLYGNETAHGGGGLAHLDLFVGGLCEPPSRGSALGETFSTIIAHQFKALRDGDRFYFENPDTRSEAELRRTGATRGDGGAVPMFAPQVVDALRATTMKDLLQRHVAFPGVLRFPLSRLHSAFHVMTLREGVLP